MEENDERSNELLPEYNVGDTEARFSCRRPRLCSASASVVAVGICPQVGDKAGRGRGRPYAPSAWAAADDVPVATDACRMAMVLMPNAASHGRGPVKPLVEG